MKAKQFWGEGADDWAEIQAPLHMPLYEGILDALALAPGSTLLDAGCGSGIVSFLAQQRGLCVTGLDVSPKFIEAARRRVPGVEFIVGDLQQLPFQSDTLDAVVGCNSFQFPAHPSVAVREAARVLHDGGQLAVAVFDLPQKCDALKPIAATYSLLESYPAGMPPPFALSDQQKLQALIRDNGMAEPAFHHIDTPMKYADLEIALRAFMSTGPAYEARTIVGEAKLREVLQRAIEPFRRPDGSYLLHNVFMIAVARKPAQ